MDSSQILSRAFALVLTNSKRTGVGRIVGYPEVGQKRAFGLEEFPHGRKFENESKRRLTWGISPQFI
jgi:hypothetical protein